MRILVLLTACLACLNSPGSSADDYPLKPIRLIVPLAAGGGVDALARAIASELSTSMGQNVIVDNRSGAAGSIGASLAAQAAPDGYTLLMASSTFLLYPLMHVKSYQPQDDFAPITQAAALPLVLIASTQTPVSTARELIDLGKKDRQALRYGSSGTGGFPHLAVVLLESTTGAGFVHVPYKGNAPAILDLASGRIQFMFAGMNLSRPHIRSGKVRALAVSGSTRLTTAPDIPTLAESGATDYDATQAYGLLAPAGTSPARVERLHAEIKAALGRPSVVKLMRADGSVAVGSSPKAFGEHIRKETAKWRQVVKQAGLDTL